MEEKTAQLLIELNSAFYAEHAESFSATRSAPWDGWRRVIEETLPFPTQRRTTQQAAQSTPTAAQDTLLADQSTLQTAPGTSTAAQKPLHILDIACGNLRFEKYLAEELLGGVGAQPPVLPAISIHAVDNCTALMNSHSADWDKSGIDVIPCERDILSALLDGTDPLAGFPPADLTVCFGFMHHVPDRELRQQLIKFLVRHTGPGGFVALSFWRFMDDERLARKTRQAEELAAHAHAEELLTLDPRELEAGDYLLGWQDDASAFRYCHHVDEVEVDALAASLPAGLAREVTRFDADGKSGRLNRYLVLERL